MVAANLRGAAQGAAGLRRALPRRLARRSITTAEAMLASDHSLTRPTLKQLIQAKKPAIGALTDGLQGDTTHVEMLGLFDYDFLWVDCEHSAATPSSVEGLYLAAERRNLATITRVGENSVGGSVGHIAKHLWAGSQGILIPACENAEAAARVVDAVKFPPLGSRGLAGDRWCNWGIGGRDMGALVAEANAKTVVGVQIENEAGAANLEAILDVEDVDFVFLGPTDLSAAMGKAVPTWLARKLGS